MAVVTIQIGQCGNQLGQQFFNTLIEDVKSIPSKRQSKQEKEYESSALDRFFDVRNDGIPEARAIMLDMEKKVVEKVSAADGRTNSWRYPKKSRFIGTKGSGNNWAHGYCIGGPTSCDDIIDIINTQAEKCDSLSGFIVPMSLAGGTGSGLGSFMTEKIKDYFPQKFIVNQVICPYDGGEVAVQNYNCVLSLSHLYHQSDMIILQENSNLHKICHKRLNVAKPSLLNLNQVASHQMCSIVAPLRNYPSSIGDMIHNLCSVPDLKLVSVWSTPQESEHVRKFSSHSWQSLTKYLKQMLVTNSYVDQGVDWTNSVSTLKSLTNLLILRGTELNSGVKQGNVFLSDDLYCNKFGIVPRLTVWSESRRYLGYDKVATLVNNGQLPIPRINSITQKSWNMYNYKAYVHQYQRYSLTDDEFIEAFATMEQIIHNYTNLT